MTPFWWAVALAAPAVPAADKVPPTPPVASLAPSLAAWHGEWTGTGTAFGKPATAALTIGRGPPGGRETALSYRLSIEGSPPVTYSAEAAYDVYAGGRVDGQWTDNRGRTRPVSGAVGGATWWTHWGSADVEIGRSTYVLEKGGTLAVSDSILQPDGRWRVFAMLRYHRTKA